MDTGIEQLKRATKTPETNSGAAREVAGSMLEDIRSRGEDAVRDYAAKLDGWTGDMVMTPEDIELRTRDVPADAGAAAGGPQRQLTGEKASGTVKFFNSMKGFGFIQRDDGQPDAFVHISAVERAGIPTLNEGDRLEFEIEVDRRGKYAAVNLQPIS